MTEKPAGEGENDAIETKAESRFLLSHSRPDPRAFQARRHSHLTSYVLRKWQHQSMRPLALRIFHVLCETKVDLIDHDLWVDELPGLKPVRCSCSL